MRMAEELAKRSTCQRNQVGTVITNFELTQVLGIGYNGNARGFPNRCDGDLPGQCGCIHSETNALIKAGASLAGKVMFVTVAPCLMCAKLVVNTGVGRVYYRRPYRLMEGVELMRKAGIEVSPYDAFEHLWR